MSTVADQPTIAQRMAIPGPGATTETASREVPQHRPSPPAPPEPREDRPYFITADTFLAMNEAGVFPDEARVYLQDGRIYEKKAKTQAHSMAAGPLVDSLVRRIVRPYWLLPEGQFRIDDWNAKLPDLAVIRCDDLRARLQSGEGLTAADIVLAVEIAVTSLSRGLGENLERYARGMIPNYWVADIAGRRLLAHAEPRVVDGIGSYANVEIILPGGAIDLLIDGQSPVRFAFEDLML